MVLDLWLFNDLRATPLRCALHAGQVQTLVTASMVAELAAVLARPFALGRGVPAEAVLAHLAACSRTVEVPVHQAPLPPRCSDADDQKFIDLAWFASASWLFSRDRAVLKLARATRARGLRIAPPEAWPGHAAASVGKPRA